MLWTTSIRCGWFVVIACLGARVVSQEIPRARAFAVRPLLRSRWRERSVGAGRPKGKPLKPLGSGSVPSVSGIVETTEILLEKDGDRADPMSRESRGFPS